MELFPLFLHALPYGLGLSALLAAGFVGGMWYNPEIMLNDYPSDVKAAYGPARNPNSRRQALWLGLFLILVVFGVLAAALLSLPPADGFGEGYWNGLVTIWTVLMVFNLVDLLLIDFPLVFFQPKRFTLPGTQGMKGYTDYRIHVRGFFIGALGITLASLALALIPAGLWLL